MPLTPQDVERRLHECPGWTVRDDGLEKTFTFDGFPDAIAFVTRLAFDAEAADHHPDLSINYRRVSVRWTTHSDGGVTEKDFAGVAQAERLAAR